MYKHEVPAHTLDDGSEIYDQLQVKDNCIFSYLQSTLLNI